MVKESLEKNDKDCFVELTQNELCNIDGGGYGTTLLKFAFATYDTVNRAVKGFDRGVRRGWRAGGRSSKRRSSRSRRARGHVR